MKNHRLSRRSLLQGAAAAGAALAYTNLSGGSLLSTAFGQVEPEKPCLLLIFLDGGYNSLFCSADSFVSANTFGCTGSNTKDLGNGLVVDGATFGTMPSQALSHMSTIGVHHGITSHDGAQNADMSDGTRSYGLQLAASMGGDASIKCAVVGDRMPAGPAPAESGVSRQQILDMNSTIAALGGAADPATPKREIAAAGMITSQQMSNHRIIQSPKSLRTVKDGFDTAIETLKQPVQTLDYNEMATAYGIATTTTAVSNFRTQMVAAELMVRAGANVIFAVDGGWDTHGDSNGDNVRAQMNNRILPPLNTFLQRTLTMTNKNVVTAIIGDFARSLPGSDHATALSATVIGKYVKVGTTGRVSANVTLPSGSPGPQEFWAYLADILKVSSQPFGSNPHSALVL
ncbi:MAG: DUF1501 domain-containing protein [Myxococcaceae bacterium]